MSYAFILARQVEYYYPREEDESKRPAQNQPLSLQKNDQIVKEIDFVVCQSFRSLFHLSILFLE